MPRQPQEPTAPTGAPRAKVCKALRTDGQPCRRQAVRGLTVCLSHGGGTAASVNKSKRASVSATAAALWGITPDTGGISVEEELQSLARNKVTDIIAIRIEISKDLGGHIGQLLEGRTKVEYDIEGTVQSKSGTQVTYNRRAGVSPWVQELHKAEGELLQILKLLQEVTGGTEQVDTRRIRMQTARETARILKAFPGISVDEVALEVSKRAS